MRHAILLFGDSLRSSYLLWRTGFVAPDPVIYFEVDGNPTLFVSMMELDRANREAQIDFVRSFEEFDFSRIQIRTGDSERAFAELIESILAEAGVKQVSVRPEFPIGTARLLEQRGLLVISDSDLFRSERRRKTQAEVESIRRSQGGAQASMEFAHGVLRDCEVRDGNLFYEGETLTSSRLLGLVESHLFQNGFGTIGNIVAGGPRSGDPHVFFDESPLRPNEPVLLDVFPFHRSSRYFGDLTRTLVVGEPSQKWIDMYEAVREAQSLALGMLGPGVDARDIHIAVSRLLFEAGFSTSVEGFRRDGLPAMTHGTGHGVGIEIHEEPRLSVVSEELREGDVVTIEPGLYDTDEGGVRLEDLAVITREGFENLTNYPLDWRV